jgi:hypothetical protein
MTRASPQIGLTKFLFAAASLLFILGYSSVVYSALLIDLHPWNQRSLSLLVEETRIENAHANLAVLRGRDIVLLVDKSRSMAKIDCPEPFVRETQPLITVGPTEATLTSRWLWCKQQIGHLLQQTKGILPDCIEVVLFSSRCEVFTKIEPEVLSSIFTDNKPAGGTDMTLAIRNQLEQYFERKSRLGGKAKPVLITVISDQCPNDPSALRSLISRATRRMNSSAEISITFLQLGEDPRAEQLFTGLRRDAATHRGRFNIVTLNSFQELCSGGIAPALVHAVSSAQ